MLSHIIWAVGGCYVGSAAVVVAVSVYDWRRWRRRERPVPFVRCVGLNLWLLLLPTLMSCAWAVAAIVGGAK